MTSESLPTRERGLKYKSIPQRGCSHHVAPYAGAWIEIQVPGDNRITSVVAPYAGAWIEIPTKCL